MKHFTKISVAKLNRPLPPSIIYTDIFSDLITFNTVANIVLAVELKTYHLNALPFAEKNFLREKCITK